MIYIGKAFDVDKMDDWQILVKYVICQTGANYYKGYSFMT